VGKHTGPTVTEEEEEEKAPSTLSVKPSDFTVTSYLKEKLSKLRSFDRQ
jgi:hypothetical protein